MLRGSGVRGIGREEVINEGVSGLEAVCSVTAVIEEEGGGGVREGFGLYNSIGDRPHIFLILSVTKFFEMFCGSSAEGV